MKKFKFESWRSSSLSVSNFKSNLLICMVNKKLGQFTDISGILYPEQNVLWEVEKQGIICFRPYPFMVQVWFVCVSVCVSVFGKIMDNCEGGGIFKNS